MIKYTRGYNKVTEKGCENMSKQAYQKYRKEKDKRHMGKPDNRPSDLGKVISEEGKPDNRKH